jgi:hypothetical protein
LTLEIIVAAKSIQKIEFQDINNSQTEDTYMKEIKEKTLGGIYDMLLKQQHAKLIFRTIKQLS